MSKMSASQTVKETAKPSRVVIDASGLVLGRLASLAAKQILEGHEVIVVNAENTIISGSRKKTVEAYKEQLKTRTLANQEKAPKHPRRPDTYVRRVVRGMLPWKRPAGKRAFRKLKVYIGLPEELASTQIPPTTAAKKNVRSFMTVGELMTIFGWKAMQNRTE